MKVENFSKPELQRRVALLDRVSQDERESESFREAARLERERLARILEAKRTIKRVAVAALVVLALTFGLHRVEPGRVEAQSAPYSVPCPQGSGVLPFGQTQDASGKLVAFACVDPFGKVTLQPDTVNGRTAVQQAGTAVTVGQLKIETVNATPVAASNTGAETTLMTFTLAANELAVNQNLRITARGVLNNSSGSTVTYTFKVYIGSNVVISAGASSIATGNAAGWFLGTDAICVTAGSGGTIEAQSSGINTNPSGSVGLSFASNNSATFPLDTTVSQIVKVTVTMSLANTLASATQRQFVIERLN